MLRDLAELTELDEGDPQSFRVRAYESAAQAIAAQATDLGQLTVQGAAADPGRSARAPPRRSASCSRPAAWRSSRRCARSTRAGVVALLRIQGLGPKAVQRLRAELGVESIDDLRAALAEHRCASSTGFGAKSEEKLAQALARLDAQGPVEPHADLGRAPARDAHRRAPARGARASPTPSYCGSLRRFCETIGDVDIVVAASDPGPVMEALVVAAGWSSACSVRGDSKTSVVTHRGTQVDLRVVAAHQLGAALLYFTGSKGHNIKLRQRALARGLTLNEYALSEIDGGRVVASETEEQIYAALGLPWIPPVLREDAGEIEAAERGALPRPIGDVIGDFHVHTSRLGRRPLDARGGGRGRARARLPRARDHRPRRGHALGRRARGAARAARGDPRAAGRARRLARLLHGVELNIGPNGRARLRRRVPQRLRLVPRLGARPLRAGPRGPDPARRHGDAGPVGAHDRPPLRAHDRRRARRSTSISTRSSPPPRRPAPRSR